ncbi:MAG TPA: isoprenylcysteine carboxylmethyltransferase family protein [Candidatus Paceibacterota bacterium]|nr:isoprenylcysteine carboxylmethyltransferase family protein [Candidatus Paceibacterota bacterium]
MKQNMRLFSPDIILVFIIFQILAHYFFPLIGIINSPYNYLGIFLIVIGQIPNFWIYFHFKKLRTTLKIYKMPNKLVTSGLFRISRNPNYLGMFITLLGMAILLGTLMPFIFPVIFFILTDRFVIPLEEKNLKKAFGKKYLDYKRKVRRWI